jgi:hypothetical protein
MHAQRTPGRPANPCDGPGIAFTVEMAVEGPRVRLSTTCEATGHRDAQTPRVRNISCERRPPEPAAIFALCMGNHGYSVIGVEGSYVGMR